MNGNMHLLNGIKVFSATMVHDRQILGERVTDWMREHSQHEILDVVITQSSDSAYHCIAITVFYRDPSLASRSPAPTRRLAFGSTK